MNDDWLTIGFGVGVARSGILLSASCSPPPARRKVLTMNRKTVAG